MRPSSPKAVPRRTILADLIPQIVRDFDWPKSMRWGDASVSTASPRWVRPLAGIVALLGDAVVAFDAAGIASGRTTFGHRFLSSGAVEIASAATYADQLRAAHVVLDPAERAAIIVAGAEAAAAAAGLTLVPDAGLVTENAGLTEWPVPLLGRFDPAFLDVPREVIQLTMRTNQKYFACVDAGGALAPAFVCVANLPDSTGAIVAGNQKVLAARLADAKFFWDADRAATLESRLPKLGTSSSTKSSAPSPTRSSGWRSWRAGWSRAGGQARHLPHRHPGERRDPIRRAPCRTGIGSRRSPG